jgi:hypothetical protein
MALALSALIFVGVAVAWSNTRPRTFTGEIQDSSCAGSRACRTRVRPIMCTSRGEMGSLRFVTRENLSS